MVKVKIRIKSEEEFVMEKRFLSVQDIALIAMFTALIAVCSWISIPVGPVPFTLQTFGVFVTAGVLGTKKGTISVFAYILIGLIGIPVFAGFTSGPGVLAGPTGGFIIGFIFTAIIVGVMTTFIKVSGEWTKVIVLIGAMILGAASYFAFGTIWFVFAMKSTVSQALVLCVIPFIVPDLVKIVVATIVVNRLKKYVKIFG